MPEYPEVTIVQKALNKHVKDRTIIKVEVRVEKLIKNIDPEGFSEFLKNKLILNIENFGKYIVFNFNDQSRLISHLRMAGKYYIREANDPYLYSYKHDCIYFFLDNHQVMVYNDTRMFGSFEIVEKDNKDSLYQIKKLAKLPGEVNAKELYEKIKTKNISIKKILLDQSLVLGIGNIYADEALFAAQIYPMTKAKDISFKKFQELLNYAQVIMDKSIEFGGSSVKDYSSVNGINGKFQNELKVYGRSGKECLRCQKYIIKKVKLDFKENGRGTSYCENCQRKE
ncbi:DNA-formamidopyrimidine glycosylase [Mycoplasmopsis bovirhinis]|uniref:Formamidopyrimidine-DNA glycosylase n=1 Tax=Mycoplasmopsis bovirhinis TaxID=29553 RepID=A0A224AYK8_9BACT|nr:DNA-formamidopyrimidine glycosylase [Mycoplasmopsis bovirhinis]BBA22428.1 DNA-formamidopyrimidine glycosylase [Mycoplasmopsis bovirhinis]VEU62756.1 Formamidopyrimidine-DNA glycosylase [Mycoplasmopsis bovirhinis]